MSSNSSSPSAQVDVRSKESSPVAISTAAATQSLPNLSIDEERASMSHALEEEDGSPAVRKAKLADASASSKMQSLHQFDCSKDQAHDLTELDDIQAINDDAGVTINNADEEDACDHDDDDDDDEIMDDDIGEESHQSVSAILRMESPDLLHRVALHSKTSQMFELRFIMHQHLVSDADDTRRVVEQNIRNRLNSSTSADAPSSTSPNAIQRVTQSRQGHDDRRQANNNVTRANSSTPESTTDDGADEETQGQQVGPSGIDGSIGEEERQQNTAPVAASTSPVTRADSTSEMTRSTPITAPTTPTSAGAARTQPASPMSTASSASELALDILEAFLNSARNSNATASTGASSSPTLAFRMESASPDAYDSAHGEDTADAPPTFVAVNETVANNNDNNDGGTSNSSSSSGGRESVRVPPPVYPRPVIRSTSRTTATTVSSSARGVSAHVHQQMAQEEMRRRRADVSAMAQQHRVQSVLSGSHRRALESVFGSPPPDIAGADDTQDGGSTQRESASASELRALNGRGVVSHMLNRRHFVTNISASLATSSHTHAGPQRYDVWRQIQHAVQRRRRGVTGGQGEHDDEDEQGDNQHQEESGSMRRANDRNTVENMTQQRAAHPGATDQNQAGVRAPIAPQRNVRLIGANARAPRQNVQQPGGRNPAMSQELSQLLASHLVQNMLSGRFRTVLELHLQNIAQSRGHQRRSRTQSPRQTRRSRSRLYHNTSTQQQQQQQQQQQEMSPTATATTTPAPVPPPPPPAHSLAQLVSGARPPSHLPPPPPPPLSHAGTQRLPSTVHAREPQGRQGGLAVNLLTRRVEEMSRQIADLVALVQSTHQNQMLMERALRQEVAAALHGQPPQALPSTSSTPSSSSAPALGNNCVVCLQERANTVMYRCGHLCACAGCAAKILEDGHNCPCCRAPVTDVLRAYTP